MKKINILSKNVYNRIAAGEVVDRPYSVVKELVENSIDAGATEIEIYIEVGGKQLVRINDNGSGIYKDDLPAAYLPHATSKIFGVEDLDDISTLGFRGEALASISAVSKVEIISVTAGNPAYKLRCEGGVTGKVEPAALEKGTSITVRDLFYNTPVRAKFLKTDKKEETDITNLVTRYILGNSSISFKYYIDGKLSLQSFGGGLEEAVAQVYGAKVLTQCFKINAVKDDIHINGFIGNQNFFKPNKSYQTTFLNGRYIVNYTINTAIGNAYSSYAMKRQYPFYVLDIDVPSDFVDVNVHPNKADVRFADNNRIFGVIYKVISAVLDGTASAAEFVVNSGRIPEIKSTIPEENKPAEQPVQTVIEQAATEQSGKDSTSDVSDELIEKYMPQKFVAFPEDILKKLPPKQVHESPKSLSSTFVPEDKLPFAVYYGGEEEEMRKYGSKVVIDDSKPRLSETYKIPPNPIIAKAIEMENEYFERQQQRIEYDNFKYRGSLFNTYLVYEYRDIVYLIDQHAAHERLIYDKLIEKVRSREVVRQPLLCPYLLEVNPEEEEFIQNNLEILTEIGFNIYLFLPHTFRIEDIPADLPDLNVEEFFDEVLSELGSYKEIKLETLFKDKLAMTACKNAVKAGMILTDEEANTLFKMMDGNEGLKCPHGRPVCVKLTKRQIEKMFKRIV